MSFEKMSTCYLLLQTTVLLNFLPFSVCSHGDVSSSNTPHQYTEYCNRRCFNKDTKSYEEHVLCAYYPCLPSYRCGFLHKRLPFTEKEKNFVLNLHNSHRNFLASGRETRAGNSKASDMRVLSYDAELEFLAACWSNQCKESPIPAKGRDKCRATGTSAHNGQNHWATASEDYNIDWTDGKFIREAVDFWYGQLENSSKNIIDHYPNENSRHYEFFTQVVWSRTFLIGCGRTMFSVDRFVGINIVCNYSPGGNVQNKRVYSRGYPCTKYKNMTHNVMYPALCGDVRPASHDHFEPPFQLRSSKTEATTILIVLETLFNLLSFAS